MIKFFFKLSFLLFISELYAKKLLVCNNSGKSIQLDVYIKNPIDSEWKLFSGSLKNKETAFIINPYLNVMHLTINNKFKLPVFPEFTSINNDTLKLIIDNNLNIFSSNNQEFNKFKKSILNIHKMIYLSDLNDKIRNKFKDTSQIFFTYLFRIYDSLQSKINSEKFSDEIKDHFLNELRFMLLMHAYHYINYYNHYKYNIDKPLNISLNQEDILKKIENITDTNYFHYYNSENYLFRKFEHLEMLHCFKTDTCINTWDFMKKYIFPASNTEQIILFYYKNLSYNIQNQTKKEKILNEITSVKKLFNDLFIHDALKRIYESINKLNFKLIDTLYNIQTLGNDCICFKNNKEKIYFIGASWCVPCHKELKEFIRYAVTNRDKYDFTIILLDQNKKYIQQIQDTLIKISTEISFYISEGNFKSTFAMKHNIISIPKILKTDSNCVIFNSINSLKSLYD